MTRILLLGGTEEAREIAEGLADAGADFVTSLAGRTEAHYPGTVRIGGFGGIEGMAEALKGDHVEVVVDATHPFAAEISPKARRAARMAGARYLRVERQRWRRSGRDRWISVNSLEEAASLIDSGATVFLAVGAGGVAPFLDRRDLTLVVRSIEEPDLGNRHDIVVIRDRGPFTIESERALFEEWGFDAVVMKNSGGSGAAAKLVVARERGTLVYMVRRPQGQPWPTVRTPDAALKRLRRYL